MDRGGEQQGAVVRVDCSLLCACVQGVPRRAARIRVGRRSACATSKRRRWRFTPTLHAEWPRSKVNARAQSPRGLDSRALTLPQARAVRTHRRRALPAPHAASPSLPRLKAAARPCASPLRAPAAPTSRPVQPRPACPGTRWDSPTPPRRALPNGTSSLANSATTALARCDSPTTATTISPIQRHVEPRPPRRHGPGTLRLAHNRHHDQPSNDQPSNGAFDPRRPS